MSGFDWSSPEIDVAVEPQAAVAVYLNGDGDVVIRQQGDLFMEEDAVVVISPGNALKLAKAIRKLVGQQGRK